MNDLRALAEMTSAELFVVVVTMLLCLGGLMLQPFGNAIGRALLGEDPAVRRWRQAWTLRQAARRAQRLERKAQKKATREAARAAKAQGGGAKRQGPDASDVAAGAAGQLLPGQGR